MYFMCYESTGKRLSRNFEFKIVRFEVFFSEVRMTKLLRKESWSKSRFSFTKWGNMKDGVEKYQKHFLAESNIPPITRK